jgi:ADP-ribose diphosphatase
MPHNSSHQVHVVYSGKYLEMVKAGHWEYVRRARSLSAVGIIALTPDRELVLVEQYRIPVSAHAIELPAGLVGDEQHFAGESFETAARRELLEETGYQADHWEYLFDGPSSAGLAEEQVHLLFATGLRRVAAGGGDASERIQIHTVPLHELDGFLQAQRSQGKQIDLKVRLAGYFLKARPQNR